MSVYLANKTQDLLSVEEYGGAHTQRKQLRKKRSNKTLGKRKNSTKENNKYIVSVDNTIKYTIIKIVLKTKECEQSI